MSVPISARTARRIVAIAVLLVAAAVWMHPPDARASGVPAADRDAMVAVIGAQMDAFKRNDAVQAFSYASPSIQSKFGDAATFMRMVATGYAPVFRPRAVEFLDALVHHGRIVQRVWIEGPDGKPVIAIYSMGQVTGGEWRIKSVTLVEPDGTGV